ncbi:MAG: von Willebrand factor type A domain-containing protein [Saprospiraceae bacterium]|nr:von Willebrand factor type A domain-containing protein [Saprospiraceae bacterium]
MMTFIQTLFVVATMLFANPTKPVVNNLSGKVTDSKSGEVLIFATVKVFQAGKFIQGTETDIDGNYFFSAPPVGLIDIEVQYVGYEAIMIKNFEIKPGKDHRLDFKMNIDNNILNEVQIVAYKVPLVEIDNTSQGTTITAEKIRNLPTKSVDAITTTAAGNSSSTGSEISVRGSRSNETVYFLDGVRVNGNSVPQSEISFNTPNTESYTKINENQFKFVTDVPLSTFALDVDRAAYSNVRRMLNYGQLPPADAVRIEEMINYFQYNYPAPKDKDIIGVTTNFTDCPWNKELKLLHVGVQSKKMDVKEMPLSNIVFLIDVSGSMSDDNKLPLVIASCKILLEQLRPDDKVAIVTYAGQAGVALQSTKASEKAKIIAALDGLESGGSTAGAQGIITAYQIAKENFITKGNNRVILATDGDFNVGISDNQSLEKLIEEKRSTGIFLSVLGYGMGNYQDDKMQILADKGNGNHAYIDNMQEANKVLHNEFGGTMYTIAKDVKFQIEFNPATVSYYRLVGYENRMLNKEDFNNDAKDGGELGLGHQMTAIYEIGTTASAADGILSVDPLKYQSNSNKDKNLGNLDELATIKFRYKEPDADKSKKWEQVIKNTLVSQSELNDDVRFAIAVAYGGLLLRDGQTLSSKSFAPMIDMATAAKGKDDDGYRNEFIKLMRVADGIKSNTLSASIHD